MVGKGDYSITFGGVTGLMTLLVTKLVLIFTPDCFLISAAVIGVPSVGLMITFSTFGSFMMTLAPGVETSNLLMACFYGISTFKAVSYLN